MAFEFSLYIKYCYIHYFSPHTHYIIVPIHNRVELNLKAARERSPTIRRHIIYILYWRKIEEKHQLRAYNIQGRIGWSNRRGGDLYKGRFVETFQLPYGQKHCSGVII